MAALSSVAQFSLSYYRKLQLILDEPVKVANQYLIAGYHNAEAGMFKEANAAWR